MSRKIKWGIIGLGKIARQFASDMTYVSSGELFAAASRSLEKAEAFRNDFSAQMAFGSYEEIMESDVEAIYIATPHNSHVEIAKQCLENGKAVLCEKPMAISPEELDELIEVQNRTGVYLMEGMWSYFLPTLKKAKEWIENGQIGSLLHLKADFGFPAAFNPDGRLFNPALAGGSVFDIGIYPIAMACYFFNSQPKSIKTWRHNAPTGVDDDVTAIFEYEDQLAHLHCSFRSRLSNSLQIIGDKGTIDIPLFWQSRECFLKQNMEVISHFDDPREGLGYNYETQAVSEDLIAGRTESAVVPLQTSMDLQRLMFSILNPQ